MFILPSLISLVVIVVVPFLNGIRYSFTSWNGITAPSFTGLENYEKVIADVDRILSHSLKNNHIVEEDTLPNTVMYTGLLLLVYGN